MNADSSRSNGPVQINTLIEQFRKNILGHYHNNKEQEIGDILDILGEKRDFDKMPIENKLNISTLFKEIDMCNVCRDIYFNVVKTKLQIENKPQEYFSALQENIRRVKQFNSEQDSAYLARRKE